MRPPSDASLRSLEKATARYAANIDLAGEWLQARGIDRSTAERFRLGVVVSPEPGHEDMVSRLAIPSIGLRGVVSLRFRCLQGHDCKEVDCHKYLGFGEVETRLWNPRDLHAPGSKIGISEGEIDGITLRMCELPAVGVPSANNWKPHYPRLFAGYEKVYVFGDGDKAGREFNARVQREVPHAIIVTMGQDLDVNQVFQEEGSRGVWSLIEQADAPGQT
jgi:hypothetical protein